MMNNRQKAKHFKRLYEEEVNAKTIRIRFKEKLEKYVCVVQAGNGMDAIDKITHHFKEFCGDHIEKTINGNYEFTFWVKK